jgi:hypothetical protein
LYIDDCSYTGNQLSIDILNKFFNQNNTIKKANNRILVAYISDQAKNTIEIFLKNKINFEILGYNIIYPLSNYLDVKQQKDFNDKYILYYVKSNDDVKYCDKYPIYFDHKIADFLSTFPEIYQGVVPNNRNKKYLNISIKQLMKMKN